MGRSVAKVNVSKNPATRTPCRDIPVSTGLGNRYLLRSMGSEIERAWRRCLWRGSQRPNVLATGKGLRHDHPHTGLHRARPTPPAFAVDHQRDVLENVLLLHYTQSDLP